MQPVVLLKTSSTRRVAVTSRGKLKDCSSEAVTFQGVTGSESPALTSDSTVCLKYASVYVTPSAALACSAMRACAVSPKPLLTAVPGIGSCSPGKYSKLPAVEALAEEVMKASVPVVFDHFAGARASLGAGQPGFGVLVDLVRSGKAYVKLSGAYRISDRSPDYPDVAPLARVLISANSGRALWGTDWPHPDSSRVPARNSTDLAPLLQIDDGQLLNQLPLWEPDARLRRKILVETPASLYAF